MLEMGSARDFFKHNQQSQKTADQNLATIDNGWHSNTAMLKYHLNALAVTNSEHHTIDRDQGFQIWAEKTDQIRSNGNTIYLIGNGASAALASHMATDLFKNGHVRTEVFFDLSLITAISNDLSFSEVFSEPLRQRMYPKDMLVAISNSGNSPNIVKAVETARQLDGFIVTISAMNPQNHLRNKGDLNFYVPAQTYGSSETCHAAILHYWADLAISKVKKVSENHTNLVRTNF